MILEETKVDKIIALIKEGKSYKEVAKEIGCAISTVSYHCNTNSMVSSKKVRVYTKIEISEAIEYYKTHTAKEVKEKFGMSKITLQKYNNGQVVKSKNLSSKQVKENKIKAVKNRRKELKILAVEYKGGSCCKCGYDRYIGALEFHHINPEEKDFVVSKNTMSWEKMKKELDKCEMLCANCHREIHAGM